MNDLNLSWLYMAAVRFFNNDWLEVDQMHPSDICFSNMNRCFVGEVENEKEEETMTSKKLTP